MNDWAEFRHFRYLLAIVEHEGFRAAAEHLHTAQPNLSAQAKHFQDLSELHLFHRGKDGRIKLTETGIAFRSIAQGVLDTRDEAIAALVAVERGEIRSFKFGCSPCVDRAVFQTACELHKEIVPACPIRAKHGDAVQLVEEIISGEIDAAILTLPVNDLLLCVEEIQHDRLVACLRRDHPHASKSVLQSADLQENLAIFYQPQLHPDAHGRLVERLAHAGIRIDDYSRASHPSEMQELVKQGYGFALIREGVALDAELTTRPIAGVDWTVDTAIVYHKQHHLKTIPVLIRHLKRHLAASANKSNVGSAITATHPRDGIRKRDPSSDGKKRTQMSLLS
jgi:DNA-binding transcriptional LysR family regulator